MVAGKIASVLVAIAWPWRGNLLGPKKSLEPDHPRRQKYENSRVQFGEDNFILKIMDENEIWSEDQNVILQVFWKKFC